MKKTKPEYDGAEHRKACQDNVHYPELVEMLAISVLYDERLATARGSLSSFSNSASVQRLVKLGCAEDLLLNSAAFALKWIELSPKLPGPGELEKIADAANSMLDGLKRHIPQHVIPLRLYGGGQPDEDVLLYAGGDMYISPELENAVTRIAGAAMHFAEIIRARDNPDARDLRSFAKLWPAVYVESATGKPHLEAVVSFMVEVGLTNGGYPELYKSKTRMKADVPRLEIWLIHALKRLSGS